MSFPLGPAGAALLAIGWGAGAQALDYETCIGAIAGDPDRALSAAQAWAEESGASAARHCEALALAATGARRTAAAKLVRLAEAPDLPDGVRAEILGQAAELHGEEGFEREERAALDAAIELAPGRAALRIARSEALVRAGDLSGALADLDRAVAAEPGSGLALALRAAARRRNGDVAGALLDARAATEAAPDEPAGWLELGISRVGSDPEAARRHWLQAIALDRGGPVAEAAQGRIAALDGG